MADEPKHGYVSDEQLKKIRAQRKKRPGIIQYKAKRQKFEKFKAQKRNRAMLSGGLPSLGKHSR